MNSRPAFFRHQLAPALICLGLALALAQSPWLQRVEDITLDFRTRASASPTSPRPMRAWR